MKVIENQAFDMERALYGSNGVLVSNCAFDGLTLENCKIIGTEPLCYCKNLKLIHFEMADTDLVFEKSEVEAHVTTKVDRKHRGALCENF